MGNPTTVLEMYPHIKEIFIAGGCEVTIDDIKGFLQFPANFKEYLLRFSLGYVPSRGGVLLSLCHKFTMPTSDWARYHQHRVQQYQIYLLIHIHFT